MKLYRHIIASILLVVFCVIQFTDIHVLTHDDGDGDCAICLLNSDNLNDFTSSDIVEIPEMTIIPADSVRSNYVNNYFESPVKYSFLNKAPPAA